jgi:UMP-CMP kinase
MQIQPSQLVIFFDASEETLVKRLLKRGETSGRADDNAETVKQRLRTFQQATRPVIDYYGAQGKLVTVRPVFAIACLKTFFGWKIYISDCALKTHGQ